MPALSESRSSGDRDGMGVEIPGPSCPAILPELVSAGLKQETLPQYIKQRAIWEVSTLTSDLHVHIHQHANMLMHIYTPHTSTEGGGEGETPVTLTQLLGHCVDTQLY